MQEGLKIIEASGGDGIWASILGPAVGAVIALVGVSLTLLHNARQRRREWEHAQRREVYLQAAEALAQNATFLAAFANLDVPMQQHVSTLQGHPGWMNKVQIVASLETLRAVSGSFETFLSRVRPLVRARFHLEGVVHRAGVARARQEQLANYVNQLTTALNALGQQPATPETRPRFLELLNELQAAQLRLQEAEAETERLFETRWQLHRELFKSSVEASAEFQKSLANVSQAIRKDLGVRTTPDEHQRLIVASAENAASKLRDLLTDLEKEEASDQASEEQVDPGEGGRGLSDQAEDTSDDPSRQA